MTKQTPPPSKSLPWPSFLKEHWIWIAPLGYVYVSYVGMVGLWYRFRPFGINVFEFAQINDFFLAALRQPRSLWAVALVVAVLILLGFLQLWLSDKVQRLWERLKQKLSRADARRLDPVDYLGRPEQLLWLLYLIIAPMPAQQIVNGGYGEHWQGDLLDDPARRVTAFIEPMYDTGSAGDPIENLVLLGTTGRFVMLLQPDTGYIVVPSSGVVVQRQGAVQDGA